MGTVSLLIFGDIIKWFTINESYTKRLSGPITVVIAVNSLFFFGGGGWMNGC